MALRLRRGTDAERLLITPLQGEPIFTTDTKRLYVGDGSTIGGVLVTGDQSNTQVLADTSPQLGGDLDLNGNNITGAGNIAIDGTITATGSINLGDGDDDNVAVVGLINTNLRPAIDGAYDIGTSLRRWNNVWAEGINISGQLTADSVSVEKIISQDSTVLYEAVSNTVTANFVGDVTGDLTGNADGNHTGSFSGLVTGTDGQTHTINSLQANDVNITGGSLVNVEIGTDTYSNVNIVAEEVKAKDGFFGSLFGSVVGNLQGTVYANDSSVIVDGESGVVTGTVAGYIDTTLPINVDTRGTNSDLVNLVADPGDKSISIYSTIGGSFPTGGQMSFYAFNGSYENRTPVSDGDVFGQINFGGSLLTANGQVDDFLPAIINAKLETASDGVSTYPKSAIEFVVFGGPNLPQDLQRANFNADGVFSAPIIQPGTYADATARDAAITAPAAGMMVFVTDVAKFQGYDGTAWVNLN